MKKETQRATWNVVKVEGQVECTTSKKFAHRLWAAGRALSSCQDPGSQALTAISHGWRVGEQGGRRETESPLLDGAA